jgi:transcriptional regulator with XRE-family HTH domain
MTTAERVRLARKRRGLTQKALSEAAGLSNAYVGLLERSLDPERPAAASCIESPGVDALERLAVALDVPIAWLAFGLEPEPTWDDGVPDTERATP